VDRGRPISTKLSLLSGKNPALGNPDVDISTSRCRSIDL
jgi:hypothetical protein